MNKPLHTVQLCGLLTVVASGQNLVDSTFNLRNWGNSSYLENLASADGVLLVAANGGQLFRSLDTGKSWRLFPMPDAGSMHRAFPRLQFDPTSSLFYGSSFAGTFTAAPRAAGWTRLFDGMPHWYSIDGSTFASNDWPHEGMNVSRDQGRTWRTTNRFESFGGAGFPLAAGGCVYVAASEIPISVSCDGGSTWKAPGTDTLTLSARSMIRHENAVIAMGQHGPARSVDSGKSWTSWRGNLAYDTQPWDLSWWGKSLFAFSFSAAYRSVDGGRSWQDLTPPDSSQNTPQYSRELVEVAGALITATRQGLKTSTDGGRTWEPIPVRSIRSRIHSLTARGNALLAHADEGIFVSRDSGATWDASLPAAAKLPWTVLTGSGALHAAGSQDGKVRVSADAGSSWSRPLSLPSSAPVSGLAVFEGALFAGSTGGLWRLSVPDSVWVPYPLPTADSIKSLASSANAILITANAHLWVIRPDGSLTDHSAGIAVGKVMGTWIIEEKLFAYTTDGFLHQWNPGSASWSRLPSSFSRHIISMVGNGNLLVAATYMGTSVSEDGGLTWYVLPNANGMTALAITEGALYAGGEEGGIWHSRLTLPTTSLRPSGSGKTRMRRAQTFPADFFESNRRVDGRAIDR